MTRARLRRWLATAAVLLVGLSVLLPGSPFYLPDLVVRTEGYGGRSLRSWAGDLDHENAADRYAAIKAVGASGAGGAEAVPALAGLLESPDVRDRELASFALIRMAPAARDAVPALARALHDASPKVRMNAALTLNVLGSQARAAVPALIAAVGRPNNQARVGLFHLSIREAAALALGRASAGTPTGVPALTEALGEARTDMGRITLARALGEVGPPARPAGPRLGALLRSSHGEVREAAREALAKITGQPLSPG